MTRRGLRREIDDEICAHIELRTKEFIAGGLDPEQARAKAERRFGGLPAYRRLYRSARRRDRSLRLRGWLENVLRDLGMGVRRIRQAPGFSALAAAIFALGIGLTATMFTVVERVLLRPLPYPEPERLVALHSVNENGDWFPYVSQGNWVDWKERNRTLSGSAIYSRNAMTVQTREGAFFAPRATVGGPFFDTIGVPMYLGRAFTEQEGLDEAPVAVVSQRFWQRVMGPDARLGAELIVGGRSWEVIGVVPDGLEFPQGTDIWLPYRYRRQTGGARNNISWFAVARLAPGVGIAQAAADLDAIAAAIRASDPAGVYSWGVHVEPLHERLTGDVSGTLKLLMGAVGFVFLVACANLAGVNYSRGSARRQEIAVRAALGAGRLRIVQQQTIENVVLALLGGGFGVVLAWWGTGVIAARTVGTLPRSAEITLDGWALAFTVAASMLAGVLAGLAPAISASSAAPKTAMGSGARLAGGHGPGSLLVAGEIALAVLLLTGAGLLLRSFGALVGRDLGFEPGGVVTADVALSSPRLLGGAGRRVRFWDDLMERTAALPGAESVAVASPAPAGGGAPRGWVDVEDHPERDDIGANYRVASEGYLELLRIPLLGGRWFGPEDTADGPRVTVVSRTLAENYWPGENPIGKRIRATSVEAPEGAPWLTVIGVAEDVRNYGFDSEIREEMYVLFRQMPRKAGAMSLLVRATGGVHAPLIDAVRQQIRALDPGLAADIDALDRRLAAGVAGRRATMSVLTSFAALAVALAAIGIYGLQAFAVAQRSHEIAVRTALGASCGTVMRETLGSATRIAVAGTLAGLLSAWWVTSLMRALLVEVSARDPLTFGVVAATLLVVAVAAAALPAWRAARLDPLEALRTT